MFESLIQGGPLLEQMFSSQQAREIQRTQAPHQLEHLKALTRLDNAQAATAEDRLATSRRMSDLVRGWKPDANDPFRSALSLVDLAAQAGSTGDMEKGIQLANVASQRQTTETYRKIQEAEIASKTAERVNGILGSMYSGLKAGPDGRIDPVQIDLLDRVARSLPEMNPQAVAAFSNAARSGGLPAIQRLFAASQAGAREAKLAVEEEKINLRRQNAEKAADLAEKRLDLVRERLEDERKRHAQDNKVAGAEASIPGKEEVRRVADQVRLIDPNFDPDQLDAASAAIASHAKRLMKAPGSALTFEQAVVRAYTQMKKTGTITSGESGWFKPKGKYDPTKIAQPNITQAEYEKLPKGAKYWWDGEQKTKE